MKSEFIQITYPHPGVALVSLNHGPVNAFHEPFWTELGNTFRELGRDGEVRAIVLASALPKYFTAGLDLGAATATLSPSDNVDPARRARILREHIIQFQNAISAIEEAPQPVIGAAHGYALGLAIDILCACDIRYAATSAIMSIKEIDVGLAADIGTLARIPKITGNQSAIRELALTTRNFGAEEALQWGFVSKVVKGGQEEVTKAALETAAIIASKSPVAVVGTKHLLLHARDHSVQESLQYTAAWNAANLQTDDITQAFQAFRTKAPPKYRSLPKL